MGPIPYQNLCKAYNKIMGPIPYHNLCKVYNKIMRPKNSKGHVNYKVKRCGETRDKLYLYAIYDTTFKCHNLNFYLLINHAYILYDVPTLPKHVFLHSG